MSYTCTIHTDYVDASKVKETLDRVTRIISEALLTEDKEKNYGEGKIHDRRAGRDGNCKTA